MTITVKANHAVHQDLINAISWLSATFRHSHNDGVSYSTSLVEAKINTAEEVSIMIKSMEIEEIETFRACWHPLFPHGVIAKGFPYRSRNEGKGLEISFADMVHMSRGLGFIEFSKGLLVEGLTSLLIPVLNLPKDNALQWHFVDKTKGESGTKSRISKILKYCGIDEWHKELLPEELINRRCFLGWVARAEVVIGTEKYDAHIRTSNAKQVPTMRHVKSHTITVGASVMGFATATYERTWLPIANPSQLVFPKDKDICDILTDGRHNNILVYDVAVGIA